MRNNRTHKTNSLFGISTRAETYAGDNLSCNWWIAGGSVWANLRVKNARRTGHIVAPKLSWVFLSGACQFLLILKTEEKSYSSKRRGKVSIKKKLCSFIQILVVDFLTWMNKNNLLYTKLPLLLLGGLKCHMYEKTHDESASCI